MPDRILIVERDGQNPNVWRYGLADAAGQLPAETWRRRWHPNTGPEPIGEWREMLWPTVILLVRQAGPGSGSSTTSP